MSKSRINIFGLSPEAIKAMQELKDKEEVGEEVDPRTSEAMKAVEMAGDIVNSVMNGRQIDMAFFKLFANKTYDRIQKLEEQRKPARRKRNKRKKAREKSRAQVRDN